MGQGMHYPDLSSFFVNYGQYGKENLARALEIGKALESGEFRVEAIMNSMSAPDISIQISNRYETFALRSANISEAIVNASALVLLWYGKADSYNLVTFDAPIAVVDKIRQMHSDKIRNFGMDEYTARVHAANAAREAHRRAMVASGRAEHVDEV